MVVCSIATVNAAKSVIVQNGTRSNVYADVAAAISAANSGDTIYIGGSVYAEAITINKPLTIFGAGMFDMASTKSTGPTQLTGGITIANGANNLTLSGMQINSVYFNNSTDLYNVTISNCYIPSRIYGNSTANYFKMKNLRVTENYIAGGTLFDYMKCTNLCRIEKNIFANSFINLVSGSNYCQFINNVFFESQGYNSGHCYGAWPFIHGFIYQTNDCAFINNVFVTNNHGPLTGNSANYYLELASDRNVYFNNFYNCAHGANFGSYETVKDNIFNSAWYGTNIFKNFADWDFTKGDYHMKDGSNLEAAGIDGLEVGLFGTTSPFKISFLPRNPHIQTISVSTETDANGQVSISATVEAQPK